MKKKLPFLIAIFCLITSFSFAQATFYVSTTGDDGNDGSDATDENAFATIQKAHDAAADGDIIEISDGTYTETSIETTKTLTIMGTSADGTIIQASASQPAGDGSDASADMDIFKVKNGKTVTFKNLTMQHGNTSNQSGGAIFATFNVNIIVENCNFFHNYSNWNGGAIWADGPSTIIKNSSFANNSSGIDGGAIGAYGDPANDPIQTLELENCTLYQNHSNGKGGALFFTNDVNFSLKNNTIAFNTTASDGRKGIYTRDNALATSITNNIFYNAESGGTEFGFDGNTPLANTNIKNNIFRQVWLADLNTEPNSISGAANVTQALLDFGTFMDNGNGLYSLAISDTSIAKDAGDLGTATTTDAHGNSRVGSPDIGAFENQTTLSTKSFELEKVSIGPNPSNGTITLENLNEPSFKLDVYGVNGAVLYSTKQSNKETIQLPQSIKGLVLIKVSSDNGSKVFKHFIK